MIVGYGAVALALVPVTLVWCWGLVADLRCVYMTGVCASEPPGDGPGGQAHIGADGSLYHRSVTVNHRWQALRSCCDVSVLLLA